MTDFRFWMDRADIGRSMLRPYEENGADLKIGHYTGEGRRESQVQTAKPGDPAYWQQSCLEWDEIKLRKAGAELPHSKRAEEWKI